MKIWLFTYDISNNKYRNTLVKELKKAGMHRIQKSVFIGRTTDQAVKNLMELIEALLQNEDSQNDSYMLLQLHEDQLEKLQILSLYRVDLDTLLGFKAVVFI